jgi:predicted transcriptional regulator
MLKKQAEEETTVEKPLEQPETSNEQVLPEQTPPTQKVTKLVSFTVRVEDSIDKRLKSLCTEESITKETFLEAAYLVCLDNEQMMQQVLEVALARRQERRSAGLVKRAEAMTRYLPSNSQ